MWLIEWLNKWNISAWKYLAYRNHSLRYILILVSKKTFILRLDITCWFVEFFVDSKKTRFQNSDQSVSISFPSEKILDAKFQLIFFTIQTNSLNSQLVTVYSSPKGQVNGDIQIEFRHLNASDRIPTCAYLKTFEK